MMNALAENGFLKPFRVFGKRECRKALAALKAAPAPADWHKGHAVTSQSYLDVARQREIVDAVAAVLGEEIMLWGAGLVCLQPGQRHVWHTDVETSGGDGHAVSVWIGLEHTNINSSLEYVTGSHRLGVSLQKMAFDKKVSRYDADSSQVLEWAQELDSQCSLEQLAISDGDAFVFHGDLWHQSRNSNAHGTRTALLLQYATPDMPIRIWQPDGLEWPFRFKAHPRPPCIMIRGENRHDANRIISMPLTEFAADTDRQLQRGAPALSSSIESLDLPRPENNETGWAPYQLFGGATPNVDHLNCHFSVLSAGVTPHEPHVHEEDEILIMLRGEATLVMNDETAGTGETRTMIRPGCFVYYPAYFRHTIWNSGPEPAVYLMLKWSSYSFSGSEPLQASIYDFDAIESDSDAESQSQMTFQKIFEGPTLYLQKLHCHLTTILPEAGYAMHSDAHDVTIIALNGVLTTLGRTVAAPAAIFYPAGAQHDMANNHQETVRYLVFEFHGPTAPDVRARRRAPKWLKRLGFNFGSA